MTHACLLAAAGLTALIGLIHSWLGERRLIGPLLAPATRRGLLRESRFARGVLRYAWHLTSLAWWGFAAIFVVLAPAPLAPPGGRILAILAATFLLTGLVVLISSRGRHLAWPLFLGIAAAAAVPLFLGGG
jgi:hypothetical protein